MSMYQEGISEEKFDLLIQAINTMTEQIVALNENLKTTTQALVSIEKQNTSVHKQYAEISTETNSILKQSTEFMNVIGQNGLQKLNTQQDRYNFYASLQEDITKKSVGTTMLGKSYHDLDERKNDEFDRDKY